MVTIDTPEKHQETLSQLSETQQTQLRKTKAAAYALGSRRVLDQNTAMDAMREFLPVEGNDGRIHSNTTDYLNALGIKTDKKNFGLRSADRKLMSGVGKAAAFGAWLEDASSEEIIAESKKMGFRMPQGLSDQQQEMWVNQTKEDMKEQFLDNLVNQHEEHTVESRGSTSVGNKLGKVGFLGGAAYSVKQKWDKDGLSLGLVGAAIGGGVKGWLLGRAAGAFGVPAIKKVAGMLGAKEWLNDLEDVINGKAKNRSQLRDAFSNAMNLSYADQEARSYENENGHEAPQATVNKPQQRTNTSDVSTTNTDSKKDPMVAFGECKTELQSDLAFMKDLAADPAFANDSFMKGVLEKVSAQLILETRKEMRELAVEAGKTTAEADALTTEAIKEASSNADKAARKTIDAETKKEKIDALKEKHPENKTITGELEKVEAKIDEAGKTVEPELAQRDTTLNTENALNKANAEYKQLEEQLKDALTQGMITQEQLGKIYEPYHAKYDEIENANRETKTVEMLALNQELNSQLTELLAGVGKAVETKELPLAERSVKDLTAQMTTAVADEDYKLAAQIRDELNQRDKKETIEADGPVAAQNNLKAMEPEALVALAEGDFAQRKAVRLELMERFNEVTGKDAAAEKQVMNALDQLSSPDRSSAVDVTAHQRQQYKAEYALLKGKGAFVDLDNNGIADVLENKPKQPDKPQAKLSDTDYIKNFAAFFMGDADITKTAQGVSGAESVEGGAVLPSGAGAKPRENTKGATV